VEAGPARAGVPAAGRARAGAGPALLSRAGVAAAGGTVAGGAGSRRALVVSGGSADGSAMMQRVRFQPDVENRGGVMAAGRAKQAAAASTACTAGRGGRAGAGVGMRVAQHEECQTGAINHCIDDTHTCGRPTTVVHALFRGQCSTAQHPW